MRKKNKGFSMVEIIIVIAIMAILAAAMAPMLIKYVGKARKSRDVDTGKEIYAACIRAAVEMGEEDITSQLGSSGSVLVRYDTVLNNPPQNVIDYAFDEFGGIPRSASHKDYYWEIEYDVTNKSIERINLTAGAGSSDKFEVYPNSEVFLEGN
ncbi:MAG: prepilin-type N-terminal cleavage/methylation domain-containing protein [Lachnospiraceae bacterium]|nr:prepilin-type N-terminal cleavage/methylation domain-containing protein [Lachnospiraceae bacterium]